MLLAKFSSPSFCTRNCSSCNSCLWACVKGFYEVLNSIGICRPHSPKLGVNNRSLFTKYYLSYCNGQSPAGATPVRPDIVTPALPRASSREPSVTTGPTDLWGHLMGPALVTYSQIASFSGACSAVLSAQRYAVPTSLNQFVAPLGGSEYLWVLSTALETPLCRSRSPWRTLEAINPCHLGVEEMDWQGYVLSFLHMLIKLWASTGS